MNRETLRVGLFTLLAGSIPRNARRISCVYYDDQGGLSRNPRKFCHPKSSPAKSASRSIILPPFWNV